MIIGPWPVPSTKCSVPVKHDDDDCDWDTESENEFTEDTLMTCL